MTKKNRAFFVCQSCEYHAPKWLGRCPDFGQWNSLVEERWESLKKEKKPTEEGSASVYSASQPLRLGTGIGAKSIPGSKAR